jgi:large subunit ribosomal protein L5
MADKKNEETKAEAAPKAEKAERAPKEKKGKREKSSVVHWDAATIRSSGAAVAPRLRERYRKEIVPALMQEFGFKNPMEVPRLTKITLNMGLGEAVSNGAMVTTAAEELSILAGQRAVITRAKKAISNFKLRGGQPIGCMVTLRKDRMWEFLDRLISVAMPRVRDFKGISGKAFDGRGNYTLGLKEQTIFPDVNYDKVEKVKGMNITLTTTAKDDKEGKALLKHLGMPFRN